MNCRFEDRPVKWGSWQVALFDMDRRFCWTFNKLNYAITDWGRELA